MRGGPYDLGMADVRVGTSGWSYPEWIGRFYPNGTSTARMLPFYGRRFDTVEAHSTYRRLPVEATLHRWRAQVPATFRIAPKAHLGITHRRDLDGIEDRVLAFAASVAPLDVRLGPVLFSLPHLEPDIIRLDRILSALSSSAVAARSESLAAFELGPKWHTAEVLERLAEARCCLVGVDDDSRDGRSTPVVGPFAYVRLRRTRYNRASLEEWAEYLAKIRAGGRDVYAFLKHDELGNGPRWARRLAASLEEG